MSDIDTRVLLDLNTRTLVNGAAVDTNLIATALDLSASQLRDCLNRLQQQRLVDLETVDLVGLTPLGHEEVARALVAASIDRPSAAGGGSTRDGTNGADSDGEVFYTSGNGDQWLLVTDTGKRRSVRHASNRSSGGASELIDLQSFLDREPHSPQNQALDRLLRG